MSDLISRQAAQIELQLRAKKYVVHDCTDGKTRTIKDDNFISVDDMLDVLKTLPSAQPERKTGRWIRYDKRFLWRFDYKCSECGNYLDFSGVNAGRGSANFCPNCGAKMEVTQDG